MELFDTWKADPRPETLTPLIQGLGPTIDRGLSTYGYQKDPNMRSAAELHLIKGLPRYDPERSKIDTWATNELKRVPRLGLQQRHSIPIPEQAASDIQSIRQAETELRHRLGRDPTPDETADATSLSVRRIGSVKSRFGAPTVTQEMVRSSEGQETAIGSQTADRDELVIDLVYGELNPVDQKIMDWSLGWHGQPKLPKAEIAKRLGLSPARITQRAGDVAERINQLDVSSVV